jgi:hypothetical protein
MTDTITLMIEDGTWVAKYGGSAAREMRNLFGTDRVPTPFTAATPAETVLAEIKRRNPCALVATITERIYR